MIRVPGPGPVLRRGRRLITDSSSRSIFVLASAVSRAVSRFTLSSFILTILSSRVRVLRGPTPGRGRPIASNTSSFSELNSGLRRLSPFNAFNASAGVPSSTDVRPPKLVVGESNPLIDEIRRSFLSIVFASAALPASHSFINDLKSTPMASY